MFSMIPTVIGDEKNAIFLLIFTRILNCNINWSYQYFSNAKKNVDNKQF